MPYVALLICLFTSVLHAGAASWSHEIVLQDYMRRYRFPEELIGYRIEFPGSFAPDRLHLREEDTEKEYQLTDVVTNERGHLTRARVLFRTPLEKGQRRVFTLEAGDRRTDFPDRVRITDIDRERHAATLSANRLQVRVPHGEFRPDAPLRDVPPPILQLSRSPGHWIGQGSLLGDLHVKRVRARAVEDGNLRLIYRIEYFVEGGRTYAVDLTVQHNESHVTIDERLAGFETRDETFFRFSYRDGVNPNARLTVSNGGYNADRTGRWAYCGRYDRDVDETGELPYQLGIWSAHSGPCVGATVFWNDGSEIDNAIIFTRYRTHEWKPPLRHIWNSGDAAENLYWYATADDAFMQTRLVGRQRHWAIAIIKEDDEDPITIESQDGSRDFYWVANAQMKGLADNKRTQRGGGPEVRLYQKLTEFSLDWVKDLPCVWDESLEARIPEEFRDRVRKRSYEEYVRSASGIAGHDNWQFVEHYWGRHLGGATSLGRAQPGWLYEYAFNRADWTPKQRQEVRSVLIHWISSVTFRDGDQAHISMISGHPNFLLETVFGGVYGAVFPNHPDAPKWKAAQERILDECLHVYMRKADPEHNALAGRWTESINCYSQASLRGLRHNIDGMKLYDGTDLLKDRPRFRDWLRWHMTALVTAMDLPETGFVFTPPQGAHTRETDHLIEGGSDRGGRNWEFYGDLYGIAERLEENSPELASQLKFCLTKGREGSNPRLESALFRDYGAVLRHDFAGPNEVYVNVQQIGSQNYVLPGYRNPPIHRSFNYRWGGRGNGLIYYAAKGRIWSWNGVEDNGDEFDIEKLPAFIVDGQGLGFHPTDGVLYDFGPVQFYRANGSRDEYRSRDVLMVGDAYLAIYDDVRDDVSGRFNWTNPIGAMPWIHKIRTGRGDNLHVVEASETATCSVRRRVGGASVTRDGATEYLFMADGPGSYRNERVSFEGRTGYAAPGHLAIFEGERIALNDASIERRGGEFGCSVRFGAAGRIEGRIVGRSGGTVRIRPPRGFEVVAPVLYVDGERKRLQVSDGALSFKVDVGITDGYKTYDILPEGQTPSE